MTVTAHTCRQCNTPFTVASEDKAILDKLEVPEPQLCAQCALKRRLAYRNQRHLFRRTCELCGRSILSNYAPGSYVRVYCRECWYSDKWDAESFSREYDPGRPFLEQFFNLMREVPQFNLFQIGQIENSEFTNAVYNLKDCYLVSSAVESEGVLYSENMDYDRDCADCYHVGRSELLYECVVTGQSYRSAYLTRCEKCADCCLCRDLEDCQDCFGSVNLRHKQFYWFNEPLHEDEYRRRLAIALASRESLAGMQNQFTEHAEHYPVEFATIHNCEDVTGNGLYTSSHVRNTFDSYDLENVHDAYRMFKAKDIYRCSHIPSGQLLYEYSAGPNNFMCACSVFCERCTSAYYSFSCQDCTHILGCTGLKKKKFCILNKQYSEEEYKKLKANIVESMKQSGEWGEFFAVEDSPHGYNDSLASDIFPLIKEYVLENKWPWNDDQGGTRGKGTVKPEDMSSTIEKVPDTITKEILVCMNCGLNYRIIGKELQILRTLRLALPLKCHECRFKERLKRHNFPPLHKRRCMCTNPKHTNHPVGDGDQYGNACPREFETTYAPGRPEIVYCGPCYQEEIA